MKTIRFSVTEDEYKIIEYEAAAKGLSVAVYARMATFSHVNKYPSKGVFAELAKMNVIPLDAAERLLSNAALEWWQSAFDRERSSRSNVRTGSGEYLSDEGES